MEAETTLGLGELIGAVKRRRHAIVGTAVPIVVVAAALALGLPDIYQSQATFTLVQSKNGDSFVDSSSRDDQYVYALTDRVRRSPQLAALSTELNPYPELVDDPAEALRRLRGDLTVNMLTEDLLDPGSTRQIKVYKGFTIVYSNRSPEMAVQVAERLPALIAELSRTVALDRVNQSINFLSSEAEKKRTQIAEQERRLAEFKQRNFDKLPEIAQANINFRSQVDRQIEDTERELRGLRQNRVFLMQQLQQEQSGPAVGNLRQLEDEYARKAAVYASDHPDVIALRRQIESLRRTGPGVSGSSLQAELDGQRAALAEVRQRYSEDHPDVRRMVRNIQSLEARIAAGESASSSRAAPTMISVQLQTQLNALDTQIAGLQVRSAELRNQMINVDMKLGSAPEVEREYQGISRDLDNARQLHDRLTNQRMAAELEAAAIMTGTSDRFRMLDAPMRPEAAARPARVRILILGLIAAVILALGSAAVAEMLDPNVRGTRDVRNVLAVTPLATVPDIHNSLFVRRHRRRLSLLTASVVIGAPLMYMVVRLLSA
jgi:uncharacterized protein involved in exopolysaccharide biosynthesis